MSEPVTTPPSGTEGDAMKLNLIAALADRSPALALVALVALAGGGGTIGSLFIAPAIDDALEKHVADEYAHARQFDRIARNEDRLSRIESQLERQGSDLAEIKGGLSAALRELERTR